MGEIWLIRSMFGSKDEAFLAAKTLLEQKLVACANITPVITSLFHWEGMLQQEDEVVLLLKTSASKAQLAIQALQALHPYQIPSILAWPAILADAKFEGWVQEQTTP